MYIKRSTRQSGNNILKRIVLFFFVAQFVICTTAWGELINITGAQQQVGGGVGYNDSDNVSHDDPDQFVPLVPQGPTDADLDISFSKYGISVLASLNSQFFEDQIIADGSGFGTAVWGSEPTDACDVHGGAASTLGVDFSTGLSPAYFYFNGQLNIDMEGDETMHPDEVYAFIRLSSNDGTQIWEVQEVGSGMSGNISVPVAHGVCLDPDQTYHLEAWAEAGTGAALDSPLFKTRTASFSFTATASPVVPDVTGMSEADAEAALLAAGFVEGEVTLGCDTVGFGLVMAQDPVACTVATLGSAVDLAISGALVPDVVGMTEAEAESALNTAGLIKGPVVQERSDTVPSGNIISQSPDPGTLVECGSSVDLVISLGTGGGGGGGGGCITIQDNFNDGIINTSIWRIVQQDEPGSQRYPFEAGGYLKIYNNGTNDSAGIFTKTLLPADKYFEAQVEFNASECAEESALFFSVHNATTDLSHQIQYALIGNAVLSDDGRQWVVIKSAGTVDEDPVTEASVITSQSTGVFYITYDYGTIYLSHTGYGAENAMVSVDIDDWTDCTEVFLGLTAWSDGPLLTGDGSYFDDFYLSTCNDGTPLEEVQDILEFVEHSVEANDLKGAGPGNSAKGRLNALINMIEETGDLIADGLYEEAYLQLEDAYKKCDGQSPPPDFVQGDAAAELADMILSLMEAL